MQRRRSPPEVEFENGNGYGHDENEFHPQANLCLNKFEVEGYYNNGEENVSSAEWRGIQNGLMRFVDDSHSLSLQNSKNEVSRPQRPHCSENNVNSLLSCDIKQSSCFIKENACNMDACRGYNQMVEALSPPSMMMRSSGKLETKIEYDTMTDEIITCSIYEV